MKINTIIGKKLYRSISLLSIVFILVISTNFITYAQESTGLSDEQKKIYSSGILYYDKGYLACSEAYNGGITGEIGYTGEIKGIYSSGITGTYVLEMFMIHVLKRMAQITGKAESDFLTTEHIVGLLAFAKGEGGDVANPSIFNPMNGGMDPKKMLGAEYSDTVWGGTGSDGRRGYPTFDIGVELYARQFLTGYQSRIGFILSKPDSTSAQFAHALTYYKDYPGNLMWAEASKDWPFKNPNGTITGGPEGYYLYQLELQKQVRNNYVSRAGLVIGTPEYEERKGIIRKDLVQYMVAKSTAPDVQANTGTTGDLTGLDASKVPEPIRTWFIKAGDKHGVPPAAIAGLYLTESNGFDGKGLFKDYLKNNKDPSVFSNITADYDIWQISKFKPNSQENGPWADGEFRGPFQFGGVWESTYHTDGNGDGVENVRDFYDEVFAAAHYMKDLGGTVEKGIEGVRKAAINYNGQTQILEEDGRAIRYVYGDQVALLTQALSGGTGPGTETCQPSTDEPPQRSGKLIYYEQDSPPYESIDIPGTSKTIGSSGCGIVSYAMAVANLKNSNVTPKTITDWMTKNNYDYPGGSRGLWLVNKGESEFGIKGDELSSSSDIKTALQAGKMVIVSGEVGDSNPEASPYTGSGHIVLLTGIDSNGKVSVLNPLKNWGKDRSYSMDVIMQGFSYASSVY